MSVNIYDLFKEEIWQPEDCTEYVWYYSNHSVYYNKDGDVDALFNGDGNTYGGEVDFEFEKDGYVIFTLDSGCGYSYQAIFKMSNKQDEDAYWESVDEEGEDG